MCVTETVFSLRILGIDAVVSKGFVHRIELVQVLIAPNPQRAGTIFEEGRNEHHSSCLHCRARA
jgi:hypothetical protein